MKTAVFVGILLLFIGPLNAQNTVEAEVYFNFNASKLTPRAEQVLDSIWAIADFGAIKRISLEGHCDHVGGDVANISLSRNRANSVGEYYRKKGWKKAPFIEGFGKTRQKYDSQLVSGQAKNRRVEVSIIYQLPEAEPMPEEGISEIIPPIEVPAEAAPMEVVKAVESIENLNAGNVVVGDRVQLDNLNFFPGTSEVLPSSEKTLKKLLKALKANPEMETLIEGHVCCNPDMELSIARAQIVRTYLMEGGIRRYRLSLKGYANTRPIADEATEEGRILNRRVEVRLLKK